MMFFYRLLGRLPLSILYALSTSVKWVFYFIISYRKKVIEKNIKNSFPALNAKQVKNLMFQFYGYLTDQLVEFFYGVLVYGIVKIDGIQRDTRKKCLKNFVVKMDDFMGRAKILF